VVAVTLSKTEGAGGGFRRGSHSENSSAAIVAERLRSHAHRVLMATGLTATELKDLGLSVLGADELHAP
jgi:hypothetical protein